MCQLVFFTFIYPEISKGLRVTVNIIRTGSPIFNQSVNLIQAFLALIANGAYYIQLS